MNLTDEQRAQRNRLKTWMKKQGISRQALADKLGYKVSYIEQILSGGNAISENCEWRLRKYYPDLNIDWLMLGDGDMLTGSQEEDVVSVASEDSPEYRRTGSLEYDLSVVAHFFETRIMDIDREVARLLRQKAELDFQKRVVEEMIEKVRRGGSDE